ncbi:hypothetical protein DSLASN_10900 [Desulfoluna limicola]|uniref:ACT domain-containing protein n=1 Tax=Desulfoluna limicola TaxID=2810562 RepID=A0ABM7PD52_9BACT|nr:hypothetical protein [Desulfoluna limicola]BCS95458.1 hypothetical protein DSLASN_10900 [Desulfoluna limicola]
MKDFCVIGYDNIDVLVKIGETLGNSKINIEGLSVSSLGESSVIHFLVDDELATLRALKEANIQVHSVTDVFVYHKDQKQVTGKPGSFGGICKTLQENNLKIQFGYPAENNRFVFGVDSIEKAKELLQ